MMKLEQFQQVVLDDFLKLPVNPSYKSTVYSSQGIQEQKNDNIEIKSNEY